MKKEKEKLLLENLGKGVCYLTTPFRMAYRLAGHTTIKNDNIKRISKWKTCIFSGSEETLWDDR